jgi:phosphoglycerate dehydrogenase-like enzyme
VWAGVFGQLMAEYVLGHIIAVERGFVALHEAQNSRVWAPRKVYRRLDNLKLGVLGIGDIGQGIAAAARTGFHMHVIGFCSNKLTYAHQDMFEKVYDYSDNGLRSLLAEVDYIVSVLPHTEKTSGLLNGLVSSHSSLTLIVAQIRCITNELMQFISYR